MSVNKKYTKLRKILDQSIQKHGGYEKLPIKKEDLQKNLKTFVEPVKKVEEMRKNYQGQFVEVSAKKKSARKNSSPSHASKRAKPAEKCFFWWRRFVWRRQERWQTKQKPSQKPQRKIKKMTRKRKALLHMQMAEERHSRKRSDRKIGRGKCHKMVQLPRQLPRQTFLL